MHVIWGDIYDPVLRFQMKEGFQFCDIIDQYLAGDKDSLENATLIVWLNHDYKPLKRRKEMRVRIAAVQYHLKRLNNWDEFEQQLNFVMDSAAEYHPHYVLLPELIYDTTFIICSN